MKKIILASLLILSNSAFSEELKPIKFNFQSTNVAQVINFVYLEALKQPYVIDPVILQDKRLVSFRFDSDKGDLKQFWLNFLKSLGYVVTIHNGADFVTTKQENEAATPDLDVLVYRPKYRSVSYLVDVLGGLFKSGSFAVQRNIKHAPNEPAPSNAPANSAAALISTDSDVLVFQGYATDVEKLKSLLTRLDLPVPEVTVNAVIYEVSTTNTDQTGFSLALNILGGKLGVNIGSPDSLANSISFKTGSFQAAITALSGDSHFKSISNPHVRIQSGAKASLIVGQDVPTLGSVSYQQGGVVPVQSIEYRSSGVIFNLTPTIHDANIDLFVDQQISDFVNTQTGVNGSPTLIKRSLQTTVSASDGEMIVLGGLLQDNKTDSNTGLSFLPKSFHSIDKTNKNTEVLLVMQVSKIQR